MSSPPIAILDSGIGGLTVMGQIYRLLPQENFLYFADTLHLPYGDKTSLQVLEYTQKNLELLLQQPTKCIVIACHTASTAVHSIRHQLPSSVIEMTQSTLELLQNSPHLHHVTLLCTESTKKSRVYEKLLHQSLPHLSLTSLACPLLVSLVEQGLYETPSIQPLIAQILTPLPLETEALLLGCTHYPWLTFLLRQILPPKIHLLDPAMTCAQQVYRIVQTQKAIPSSSPSVRFMSSDPSFPISTLQTHWEKELKKNKTYETLPLNIP